MSKFTNSNREAQDALDAGYWVLCCTPRGTRADLLGGGSYEIYADSSRAADKRPRIGAIHKSDRTGGFVPGMRVCLSETATYRSWEHGCEHITPHVAAGKSGTVEFVTDAENLIVSVIFDDIKDRDGQPVAMMVPGDWLRLA